MAQKYLVAISMSDLSNCSPQSSPKSLGSIDFPKMFRAPLCGLGTQLFTVSGHEHRDLVGRMGKMQQCSVDFHLQVGELRKILQMRRFLLDLLPQVFDRIEIWRVGGQLLNGQARRMDVEKLLHGLARMVTRSILHDDDVVPSLR